jgi:hypothetical protein
MDVVLADPHVVALILGAAGMPATGARVCKRWREALEYPVAWRRLRTTKKEHSLRLACRSGNLALARRRVALFGITRVRSPEIDIIYEESCSAGANLELVQWLADTFPIDREDIDMAVYKACADGELRVLQWLAAHYSFDSAWFARRTASVVGTACKKGHLHIARWLIARFGLRAAELADMHHCNAMGLDGGVWLVSLLGLKGCAPSADAICARVRRDESAD